jgi:hypothetical protein
LPSYLTRWILLLPLLVSPSALLAQSADETRPTKPEPAATQAANLSHDLSGTWSGRPPVGKDRTSQWGDDDGGWWNYALRPDELPMTPWAETRFHANRPSFGPTKKEDSNDGSYACLPPGVPRVYASIAAGMQIVSRPNRTLMLFGENVRQIYTDGRPHPKNVRATWMGHSIGNWDGDTFVIDTVGLDDRTWIDRMGHPHSDAMHLVERFRRVDDKTLELELTVDDPKAYTESWTARRILQLRPASSVRAGGGACEDVFINEAFGLKPKLPSRE